MLKEKKLFLLDIDGTVLKGKQLIEGTREFLRDIKESGGQYIFITNNATKSIVDYVRDFQEMGVMTDYSNFVTASYVTVQYLKKHYAAKTIYVLGTMSFIRELKRNGVRVTIDCEEPEIACALISYDNQLTYEKLSDTCKLLSTREIDYLATNPDYVCPVEFGYVPDCGAVCEMIEHAVKKKPDFLGKPATAVVECSLKLNHFTKEETLVVGDRLYTDIACGKRAGVDTALVLTGEATREDAYAAEEKPEYIFYSIQELHERWKKGDQEKQIKGGMSENACLIET